MSSIHLTVKENVVINNPEPISQPDQGIDEIDIREINKENQEVVLQEMRRLVEVRMKYNIHTPPKPDHIKFEDYGFEKKEEYQEAKNKHYKDYKAKCQNVERNISLLDNINTALCRENKKQEDEMKIKTGTFYTADEQKYLDEEENRRKGARKKYNSTYYEKNKITILENCQIKSIKKKVKEIKELKELTGNGGEEHFKHLIKNRFIIKPLCLCGRQCDVTKITTIKKHSNIEKHRLFKSVIALIHYKRKNSKLKPIIDKINNDYIDYKRVVREKRNGKSITITNKTDKEIIQLYGDYLNPIDENLTHQPRKSYIEKVKYSEHYKDIVLVLSWKVNSKTAKANTNLSN